MRIRAAAFAAAGAFAAFAPAAGAAEQQAFSAGSAYATPALAAAQGDTLRHTNLDPTAQHDLDSDTAGLFASPLVGAGESTLVGGVPKLPPGSYPFHCSIHSWMKGVLTVRAGAGPGLPPPPGGGGGGGGGNDPPDPATLLPPAKADPLEAGRWPLYGRDRANSRNGGVHGPSYNEAPRLGPVWSFKSRDGDFTATPVIGRNVLVIGSRSGTVFALDPRTGRLRWKRDLIPDRAEENAVISGSAAIWRGRAIVPVNAVGRPRLVALRLRDGRRIWRHVVDRQKRSDMYGSPMVARGRVFVGTSGYFGEQVTGAEVSARGSVTAVSARTGRRLWKTRTVPKGHDGGAVWSTPAAGPGGHRIWVGTGNAYHPPAGPMTDSMLMLSARTGKVLRYFQATADDVWNGAEDSARAPDADFGASPNLFRLPNGRAVVGQGQKSGTYWVLDRRRMRPVWTAVTGPGSFTGGILGSTAVDRRRIYGPISISGQVWALERAGSPAWTSTDGTPFHFGPVSVANGLVYSNDMSGFLTVRDVLTGMTLAKIPLGAPSWAGIAIAGGSVFTATGTSGDVGYIVAYRPRD